MRNAPVHFMVSCVNTTDHMPTPCPSIKKIVISLPEPHQSREVLLAFRQVASKLSGEIIPPVSPALTFSF